MKPAALTRIALGIAAVSVATVPVAGATTLRVRLACAGDYLAYCSQHPEEGPAVRRCMSANGQRLSDGCINALVAAGEVSKAEVERRRISGR